jgi:hypothetical protein
MNRSKPLERHTPIVATTGLARTTGLNRTPFPTVVAAPQRRIAAARSKPVAPVLRASLLERSSGACESCGLPLPEKGWHAHHRLRVAHGRIDSLSNLVALHPHCHVQAPGSVHQETGWALDRGLLVPSTTIPAVEPLWLPDGRKVWLTDTAAVYLDVPPAVAA